MAYNDSIVIEQQASARGDYGEADTGAWSTYKTVWAEITDTASSVSHESEMPVFEDSKGFKLHSADAPSVTTKMRISYDSQYFLIHSIQKEGRLRTILIASAYDDE